MKEILALVEHRQGVIRDITYELLTCGRKLADAHKCNLTAVIFGSSTEPLIEKLTSEAHHLVVADHEILENFNAEIYQLTLAEIIKQRQPSLVLLGHTAFGYDLGPALAAQLGVPFTTDCLDVTLSEGGCRVTRSVFDGKLHASVDLRHAATCIITLRSGCFPPQVSTLSADVEQTSVPLAVQPEYRRFVAYIEAAAGEVDITKADIIVSIGRGIKEQANISQIDEFVKAIGGVMACSRPIVDAGWLPKERQVGSSGKTVKPKLYIALGISGAFQHIVGMKGADTIIAVNKDANAPIFNEADYGIVDDLFKVIPAFRNKIVELKQSKGS